MTIRGNIAQLDSVRGFAAVYVFVHHARLWPNSGFGSLFYLGQEAVILFFLLSGFVIYFSTNADPRNTPTVKTYLVHRLRRIYPIMLFALALAFLGACIRAHAVVELNPVNLVANLAMIQDVSSLKRGVWVEAYYGNLPLWSLSYEWWFYMLFIPLGLVKFFPPGHEGKIAFLISVVGFLSYQIAPNPISLFAAYFIIWWTGVELAREYVVCGTVSWRRQKWTIAYLGVCSLLWASPVAIALHQHSPLRLGVDPVLQFRHFAAAFAVLVFGLIWYAHELPFFERTLGPFRIFAPISYSLYLFHVPVLQTLSTLGLGGDPLTRCLVAAALLIPLCYLLEVRLQRRINRWANRLLTRNRPD